MERWDEDLGMKGENWKVYSWHLDPGISKTEMFMYECTQLIKAKNI